MNGLMTSDFHRERFTDPTLRMTGSEAHSPQAADVVDTALTNQNIEYKAINSNNFTDNANYKLPEEIGNHSDREGEGHHPSNEIRQAEERSPDYSREKDTSLDKSFEADYHGNKYNTENSNSSDIESDVDRDELIPNSPRSESHHRLPVDYYQRLPSNLGRFGSGFSTEEARLRQQLKEFGGHPINPAAFSEADYCRRLAFSQEKGSGLFPNSSSQPNSPESKTLSGPPISPYRRLPRSADKLDETLTPNIREGLYFCHLCSFSGTTQAAFDQHMTVHFEHVCPHCDYKSRTEGRLKRHIKDFHTEDPDGGYGSRAMPGRPKVFRCKQCEYSTTDKIEFWSHSRTHIKEDKLLQCPRCPFVTEYKHHLEYHLRNHFGSKPFKCPKCNYACVNKSMLNSHMKSHTNVYQYRCADCTYATKYCHSLKLHLRKYNHKPAAVLNSDGSLPQGVDATASGLSLLSKRGPPRGPRGPRKDKMDPGGPGMPPFPMPHSPMGPLPGLHGMISPFFPMMPGHLHGGLPSHLGLSPRFGSHFAGLPGLPGIKKEDITPQIPTSSADINPFKCNFCSFVGTNREVLTSHVMKVHSSDNHDLFSIFGIPSESLLNEKKRMNAAMSSLPSPVKSPRMGYFPSDFSPSQGMKREHPDSISSKSSQEKQQYKHRDNHILSPYQFLNGKYSTNQQEGGKDESIDILKQMTLKFGSGPVNLQKKPSRPLVHHPGDTPLDLTKPRFSPPIAMGTNSPVQSDHHKTEDGNHSSGENSVYSNEVTSPTPRKRSRKGKAFKLDTLCMKLQEQHRATMDSDEDDSVDMEEYSSEILPVDATDDSFDDAKVPLSQTDDDKDDDMIDVGQENDGKRGSDNEVVTADRPGKEMGEDDFKQIHSSLKMLNENRIVGGDPREQADEPQGESPVSEETKLTYDYDMVKKEQMSEDEIGKERTSPVGNSNNNRRKGVPAAVQRGVEVAWKMFNDPKIVSNLIKTEQGDVDNMSQVDDKARLNQHDLNDSPKKDEYECPHCKIAFFDCIMYTMHMGYHGYKDPYQCNMCGDTCKDRVEFNLHIARAAHN